jgi:hypothetical protein
LLAEPSGNPTSITRSLFFRDIAVTGRRRASRLSLSLSLSIQEAFWAA